MSRYGFLFGIASAVVGLALFAWRATAVMDAQDAALAPVNGLAATGGDGGASLLKQAAQLQLVVRLQQGVRAAEVYAAEHGTYQGLTTATLASYDPAIDRSIAVGWAHDSGYCLQASGTETVHVLSDVSPPAAGPCPA